MNSSKSPGFSVSELASLSAWLLPDISENGAYSEDVERMESFDTEENPARILTVDEIESMQKQAYNEAFAQGKLEGYQQGFDQGLIEGSKQAYDENSGNLHKKAAEFAGLIESLRDPFKALDEEVERELVKLSIAIATQIIRREIKLDPGQVIASVRAAINALPLSSQKIQLYLHPEDAELVRSALSLDEMSTAWGVVEDPLITRGGCKVDTDISHVNATVENRLAAVIATLLGGERENDSKDAGVMRSEFKSEAPEQVIAAVTLAIALDTDSGDADDSMDAEDTAIDGDKAS
jgi:flagellar assembly protein FliH